MGSHSIVKDSPLRHLPAGGCEAPPIPQTIATKPRPLIAQPQLGSLVPRKSKEKILAQVRLKNARGHPIPTRYILLAISSASSQNAGIAPKSEEGGDPPGLILVIKE